MRILFIVNSTKFFVSHRIAVAEELHRNGHEVHLAAQLDIPRHRLPSWITFANIPIARGGINPVMDLTILVKMAGIIARIKPDILHLVTIKPSLYGGAIARLFKLRVIVAVSGLGSVFVESTSKRRRILKWAVLKAYRFALANRRCRVIVQNASDKAYLQAVSGISGDHIAQFPGSGVDVVKFNPNRQEQSPRIVLMASRLLAEKGVREYGEAARLILRSRGNLRFVLAGPIDSDNPSALTREEIEEICSAGKIEWIGEVGEMANLLQTTSVFVLPSYYGEGIPKVLCEALASGVPVVTTLSPGCAEAVGYGECGLLVPAKDGKALARAITELIDNSKLHLTLSEKGRRRALRQYSVQSITNMHMTLYAEMMNA